MFHARNMSFIRLYYFHGLEEMDRLVLVDFNIGIYFNPMKLIASFFFASWFSLFRCPYLDLFLALGVLNN
ncbi:hypothetical protein RchiOBHm_Chr3g0475151 [Rosa chinensis]|uniref:Uncharacterized protein n=1 Tax=Rosa chinensis TaxID=74649 RepID=A0A2P6QXS3_ROSCH|nr:hypothetical protein RchiOBHm_Chr4g0420201 [Rosa chinensis]PRQ44066.1 hypothetical protein RchiOBHm_Chr3g0475151 [Rosa chinensis]